MARIPLEIVIAAVERGHLDVARSVWALGEPTTQNRYIAIVRGVSALTADPYRSDPDAARALDEWLAGLFEDLDVDMEDRLATFNLAAAPAVAGRLARTTRKTVLETLVKNQTLPGPVAAHIARRRSGTSGKRALLHRNVGPDERMAIWAKRWAGTVSLGQLARVDGELSARALRAAGFLAAIGAPLRNPLDYLSVRLADPDVVDAVTTNGVLAGGVAGILSRNEAPSEPLSCALVRVLDDDNDVRAGRFLASVAIEGTSLGVVVDGTHRGVWRFAPANAPIAAALAGCTNHLAKARYGYLTVVDGVAFDDAVADLAILDDRGDAQHAAAHLAQNPALPARHVPALLAVLEPRNRHVLLRAPLTSAERAAIGAHPKVIDALVDALTDAGRTARSRRAGLPAWAQAWVDDRDWCATTILERPGGLRPRIWSAWVSHVVDVHPDLVDVAARRVQFGDSISAELAHRMADLLARAGDVTLIDGLAGAWGHDRSIADLADLVGRLTADRERRSR